MALLARFVGTARVHTGFRKEVQPEGDTIAPGETMTASSNEKATKLPMIKFHKKYLAPVSWNPGSQTF